MPRLLKITVLSACFLSLLISVTIRDAPAADKKIVIGSKDFVEEKIMGQMMSHLLERHGFDVQLKEGFSSIILRAGMKQGSIDLCADYTGAAYFYYLPNPYEPGIGNTRLYELLKKEDANNGLIWLYPIWNNNTYAMASWPEFAKEHDLTDLSSLAELYNREQGKIMTAIDFEFSVRPDGLFALQKVYDFTIADSKMRVSLPASPVYSLKTHTVRVAEVFETDAAIAEYGWYVYRDDKEAFPPYDLTPCVRKEILERHPEIKTILDSLVRTFPGGGKPATKEAIEACRKIWRGLNGEVSFGKKKPEEVARQYLRQHGLL